MSVCLSVCLLAEGISRLPVVQGWLGGGTAARSGTNVVMEGQVDNAVVILACLLPCLLGAYCS